MTRMRVRSSAALSVGSTLAYALSQWVLVAILARTTDTGTVGEFSLMVAMTAPVFLLLGLNLRVALATDAAGHHAPRDYVGLQLLANVASIAVGLALLPFLGPDVWPAYLVYLAAKAVEAMSTLLYGLFQQHGRMDLVARSLMVRAVVGPAAFGLGLWLQPSLLTACAGLLLAWLAAQLLDRRAAHALLDASGEGPLHAWPSRRRTPQLIRELWSLGLSAGVGSASINAPRYAVRAELGAAGLGAFTGVAYLAQVVQTAIGALGAALVPELARHLADGRRDRFDRLMRQSWLLTAAVVVLAVAIGGLVGPWLLRLAMGPQYADAPLLVALLAATGATAFYRCPARGLQAAREFRAAGAVDVLVLVLTVSLSFSLVPLMGAMGAAAAIGAAGLVGTAAASWLLRRRVLAHV